MSFTQIGFLDTANFTATYITRHRDKVENGVLALRVLQGEDVVDAAILKEWKSAKALLSRLRNAAAPFFAGQTPDLGKAWLEVLPPRSGTPWGSADEAYGGAHARTRTCLIPSPGGVSFADGASATLQVGWLHAHDPRALASEVNFDPVHARVHLIVDIRRPEPAE